MCIVRYRDPIREHKVTAHCSTSLLCRKAVTCWAVVYRLGLGKQGTVTQTVLGARLQGSPITPTSLHTLRSRLHIPEWRRMKIACSAESRQCRMWGKSNSVCWFVDCVTHFFAIGRGHNFTGQSSPKLNEQRRGFALLPFTRWERKWMGGECWFCVCGVKKVHFPNWRLIKCSPSSNIITHCHMLYITEGNYMQFNSLLWEYTMKGNSIVAVYPIWTYKCLKLRIHRGINHGMVSNTLS